MQEDFKITNKPYTPVNFLVAKIKSKRDWLWELKWEDIVMEAAPNGKLISKWEITKTDFFTPQNYIIIPNTVGESKNDERKFFLRIFASE